MATTEHIIFLSKKELEQESKERLKRLLKEREQLIVKKKELQEKKLEEKTEDLINIWKPYSDEPSFLKQDKAEEAIDFFKDEGIPLTNWKYNNSKTLGSVILTMGDYINDAVEIERIGTERFTEKRKKEEERQAQFEERIQKFDERRATALAEEAQSASDKYGYGTQEWREHMTRRTKSWNNRAPTYFPELVRYAKNWGTGEKAIKKVLGKPYIQRRLVTVPEALRIEEMTKAKKRRVDNLLKRYGKNALVYPQHRVIFCPEGTKLDPETKKCVPVGT